MSDAFNKSSFIPQKSLTPIQKRKGPSVGLFFIIAVIIFVVSIVSSIGVISYKKVLEKSLDSKAISLERAREAFDPNLIKEFSRLNQRIELSASLLNNHISITPLFALLEELTLKNVKFNTFEFSVRDSGQIELTMDGQAANYATVVLQSDVFSENRFLKNQIFSNINLDNSGNIGFSFNTRVDSDLVSFKNSVEGF